VTLPHRAPLLVIAALLGAACAPDVDLPDPAWVESLVPELHRPIYQVYALPLDRDAVWEQLAGSFTGQALTEQYVEHWTTRHRMDRESTAIDVRRVEYDQIDVLEVGPGRARVDVAWSVGGIVTHQQHKHPRVNRYRAVYTVADGAEGWRIVQTRMRDVHRVKSPSRSGGAGGIFDVLDDAPDEGGGYLDPLDLLEGGLGEDTGEPVDTDTDTDTDTDAVDVDVEPAQAPTTPSGALDPFGALDGAGEVE